MKPPWGVRERDSGPNSDRPYAGVSLVAPWTYTDANNRVHDPVTRFFQTSQLAPNVPSGDRSDAIGPRDCPRGLTSCHFSGVRSRVPGWEHTARQELP